MTSTRLKFSLAQGWTSGIEFAFENLVGSKKITRNNTLQLNQVHGCDVIDVESRFEANGDFITDGDAWFCSNKEILKDKKIAVRTADCAPIVQIDRETQCLALIHAGWRGLASGIHRTMFDRGLMNPQTTWVWLGPCLHGLNFEVSEDLWSQFENYAGDSSVFIPSENKSKKYFDVWKYLEKEYQSLGVELFYNVEVDTFEDKIFASHRRFLKQGIDNKELRNISWIKLV